MNQQQQCSLTVVTTIGKALDNISTSMVAHLFELGLHMATKLASRGHTTSCRVSRDEIARFRAVAHHLKAAE
jgi:hypothetical protein